MKPVRFVRFAHQPDGPVYRVLGDPDRDNLIELKGMTGSFAPHIFIDVRGDRVTVEKTCAGPRLLLGDCVVRQWFGTVFDNEADALAADINRRLEDGQTERQHSNYEDVMDASAGER